MPCCRAADVARASWESFGAIILVEQPRVEAPALADRLAPEHLEIATGDPEALAGRIRNAGAIFLGRYTPEVIGDYVAGPNHVLPTARSARFASGLGVLDFMKRTSILKLDAASSERARARRHDARPRRRARGPSPLRRDPAERTGLAMAEEQQREELSPEQARLIEVTLDADSLGRNSSDVEHEREVAIFDLLERNSFALESRDDGPYTLHLSLAENRLVFTVGDDERAPIVM